ncbi:MipA/OmpV family protein [Undibacterium cyanobacteriorum]|uniref:MipA/OmpV family protein n=1 Tax=Undibacterium cyanobacteriorum TaxID=3073561 RepID=A0ABY9RG70_9BURK|nr:MipA/OmpV family protein [Undibacterium sp. 20NA77.5]WMW79300.1 MipA/OmpV family protein [Undibacterium sp. 20NA77.5]
MMMASVMLTGISLTANAQLLSSSTTHAAAEEAGQQGSGSDWVRGPEASLPLWELGVSGFALSRTAYPGSDTYVSRALIVPHFLYRGEHLRVERGGTGYRAVKTPRFEFDIGFSGTLGSSSDKVLARRGMETIGHMVEFGPRLNWNLNEPNETERWRLELPLRAVFDVSDGFRRRGFTFEPELSHSHRFDSGWRYSSGISAVWGNKSFADVFYTVRPDQALADRPAYQAQSGLLTWRLSSTISKQFDRDWRFLAGLRIETVEGAANQASPLVRKKTAPSLVLGLTYTFKQSQRRSDE